MALTTYSGLKTALANWLNRTDLTSEIADDFIKLAEGDFNAKLRIRQMEQIDAITIDSETETVPTGFIGVRSFYILASSTKYVLEYITPHNMFEIKAGSTTARPRVYTIESDNEVETLRFGPAPDTSYTGYLSYYKSFTALSDTSTTNYILNNHPDPNQVQQWLQMYIAAMERCENNDRQDSYGGAPVQQRTDVQTDLSFYRAR
jgi:hypothetical protein